MSADSPSTARLYAKDVAETMAVVAAVGAILFAVTGVWPPMVAVESPSMEPHLERGDLVLVTDEGRYAGPAADTNNIITANASEGYGRIGRLGDVIVYKQPSRTDSPLTSSGA